MSISLIAAFDQNLAIGRNGALPWHLPDDLKHFKALTIGKTILMGRKTFTSIGRALPGRRNLVLSRDLAFAAPGIEVCHSLAQALLIANGQELMVIGGGELYAQTLPLADVLCLTEVELEIADADAWFPSFERSKWTELSRTRPHAIDERHSVAFSFVTLMRSADLR